MLLGHQLRLTVSGRVSFFMLLRMSAHLDTRLSSILISRFTLNLRDKSNALPNIGLEVCGSLSQLDALVLPLPSRLVGSMDQPLESSLSRTSADDFDSARSQDDATLVRSTLARENRGSSVTSEFSYVKEVGRFLFWCRDRAQRRAIAALARPRRYGCRRLEEAGDDAPGSRFWDPPLVAPQILCDEDVGHDAGLDR